LTTGPAISGETCYEPRRTDVQLIRFVFELLLDRLDLARKTLALSPIVFC
jgi:hypothetical protein